MRRLPAGLPAVVLAGLALLTACQSTGTPGTQGTPGQQAPQARDADPAPADAHQRAALRLQLASRYLQAGQSAIALDEARQAIALDPDLTDAYHVQALAQMALRRPAEAEQSFRAALSRRQDDGDLLNNYGWLLCDQGRYAEGLAQLQRAVTVPSTGGTARMLTSLGACQLRQGDLAAAHRSLTAALAQPGPMAGAYSSDAGSDAGSDAATHAAAHTQLGLLYWKQGDLPRARAEAAQVNAGRYASPASLWLGARIAHREGDAAAQQALLTQLHKRFPDSRESSAYQQGAWDE
ncbi:tetratricopeptide repeat protein [Cupriavidus gilardii]|uniref:Tetratricopeptide repeat protein n=1 Tax=Cupriavidus gilardii TaxID=82541 RepID=A0A6N1BLH3_9BURK|nr:tetratricopeptide repeat protein [Cupriavidus gilardii]QQE05978.1 tetratricopeptide repeat protein [Cupriavidus sp. ISTL7]KAB0594175.1 tetratricopeptide repeat protein [Cupriavidus gilardii]MCT9012092.1 tetratricopeptide repeat protein [Cupriavidus gilardii]MCT9053771.1 tetratricopeptide repeat protein [Cupriavidus gilardii]MCT9072496.1 tetratricopeptide repeat protein [Cupriavidus gilardii]